MRAVDELSVVGDDQPGTLPKTTSCRLDRVTPAEVPHMVGEGEVPGVEAHDYLDSLTAAASETNANVQAVHVETARIVATDGAADVVATAKMAAESAVAKGKATAEKTAAEDKKIRAIEEKEKATAENSSYLNPVPILNPAPASDAATTTKLYTLRSVRDRVAVIDATAAINAAAATTTPTKNAAAMALTYRGMTSRMGDDFLGAPQLVFSTRKKLPMEVAVVDMAATETADAKASAAAVNKENQHNASSTSRIVNTMNIETSFAPVVTSAAAAEATDMETIAAQAIAPLRAVTAKVVVAKEAGAMVAATAVTAETAEAEVVAAAALGEVEFQIEASAADNPHATPPPANPLTPSPAEDSIPRAVIGLDSSNPTGIAGTHVDVASNPVDFTGSEYTRGVKRPLSPTAEANVGQPPRTLDRSVFGRAWSGFKQFILCRQS